MLKIIPLDAKLKESIDTREYSEHATKIQLILILEWLEMGTQLLIKNTQKSI